MPDPLPIPRRLTPSDAHRYVALRRQMLADTPWAFESSPDDDPNGSDPQRVAENLAKPDHQAIVAAEDPADVTLIAAAGIFRSQRLKTAHRAMVWGVYVSPPWRGRGLGRAVVLGVLDIARREWGGRGGVEVVGLGAPAGSPAALRLYESLGFRRWGLEPDALRTEGRSYDEVYMQLTL